MKVLANQTYPNTLIPNPITTGISERAHFIISKFPNQFLEISDLTFSEDDFYDNKLRLNKFWQEYDCERFREPKDPEKWVAQMAVTSPNAYYL